MIATILGIVDQGTIVQMILKKEPSKMLDSIVFDHRMYAHLVEAQPNLVGKMIEYDDEGKGLRFLKEDEDASDI